MGIMRSWRWAQYEELYQHLPVGTGQNHEEPRQCIWSGGPRFEGGTSRRLSSSAA